MGTVDNGHSFCRIDRRQREISEALNLADHERPYQIVVLNNQDGLMAAFENRRARRHGGLGDGCRLGQINSDRRAVAFFAVNVTGQVAQPQRAEIARLKTPARLVELGRGLRLTRSSSGKPPSQ